MQFIKNFTSGIAILHLIFNIKYEKVQHKKTKQLIEKKTKNRMIYLVFSKFFFTRPTSKLTTTSTTNILVPIVDQKK